MSITKVAGIAAAVALAVTGLGVAGVTDEKTVKITDQGYMPARMEVAEGDTVIFQNDTLKDHTVSFKQPAEEPAQDEDAENPDLDSGIIKPGASWQHTFDKEGTFAYHCKEVDSMTGTVVVSPSK